MTQSIDSNNPLAPFARLIGGEWHFDGADAPLTFHRYEWGVGQKLVRSRSYARGETGDILVSEGFWFWHPAEQTIKGYDVAIEMPVAVFEYCARFEGDKMIAALTSTAPDGSSHQLDEEWAFSGEDQYVFTVYQKTADDRQKWMEGSFTRRRG